MLSRSLIELNAMAVLTMMSFALSRVVVTCCGHGQSEILEAVCML